MSVILTCLHISHKTPFSLICNSLKTWNFGQISLKKARSLADCLVKPYFPSYSPSLIYIHTVPVHMAKHLPWENFLFDKAWPQALSHFPLFGMKQILHVFYSPQPFKSDHINLYHSLFWVKVLLVPFEVIWFSFWCLASGVSSEQYLIFLLMDNPCACNHWSGLSGIIRAAFTGAKQWPSWAENDFLLHCSNYLCHGRAKLHRDCPSWAWSTLARAWFTLQKHHQRSQDWQRTCWHQFNILDSSCWPWCSYAYWKTWPFLPYLA